MASKERERLEELRRKQGPLPKDEEKRGVDSFGFKAIDAGNRFVESGLRQFISNALAVPSSIGDVLDAGGAAVDAGLGGIANVFGAGGQESFGGRFGESFARRQQSGISTLPRPTTGDVIAGAQAGGRGIENLRQQARPNFAGEFDTAQAEQQARLAGLQETSAGAAGEVAGDVATLLTGRTPIARARAPGIKSRRLAVNARDEKNFIPERVLAQTQDVLAGKILPFFKDIGIASKRGLGRIGEASVEGLILALLNDQDPLSAVALAAGAQSAGSVGLFLLTKPARRLLPTLATATVVTHLFQAVAPGDRNVFEALDFAEDKLLFASALGLFGALSGAGRRRSLNAEKFPALFDAMTSIPRGVVQSLLRELTEGEKLGVDLPRKVMEKLSSNPTFFNNNQLRSLDRALQSGKSGAFTNEVERLRKESKSFQELIDDL